MSEPTCEPCALSQRAAPAAFEYVMATCTARIPVCRNHARVMRDWAGRLESMKEAPATAS